MAASFSMALGIPFAVFIKEIGHDGSQPFFADEQFHRGFHIQECIDVCLKHEFSCTEIQAYFGSTPFFGSKETIPVYSQEACAKRFEDYLHSTFRGVLGGMVMRTNNLTVGHAVCWDSKLIHDPRGRSYSFEAAKLNNFYPQTLWILTKTEQ